MRLLVPYLFPAARVWETATPGVRLPALETLLARGCRISCPANGVEAAVCEALGIARQQDYPVAPVSLEADGGHAGDEYWLRADPVYLAVMRDRILLASGDALNLSRDEADALTSTLRAHFGETFAPLALHPQRWYLHGARPDLITTPLALAAGRDVRQLQPLGSAALRFRALVNEAQMLLHDHPVNRAREAQGFLPANSLWLWGGGTLPRKPDVSPLLYTSRPDIAALVHFAGGHCLPAPERWDIGIALDADVVLETLVSAGVSGDILAWRQALQEFERAWCAPALRAIQSGKLAQLDVQDPLHGSESIIRRADVWKLWRRIKPLAEYTPP